MTTRFFSRDRESLRITAAAWLLLTSLISAGCGDDDDGSRPATATPSAIATATATVPATATPESTATQPATPTPSTLPTLVPPTSTFTRIPADTPTPLPTSTATATDTPTAEPSIFGNLGDPLPMASAEQLATFDRGHQVALRVFSAEDGLGPKFNSASCGSCHEKPVLGGSGARYRNFLLVRAVLGDGSSIPTGVNGVQPQFTLAPGGREPSDPDTNLSATRNPIPFFGVGLVAELPESAILVREDVNDGDGDGISGRANYDRGFVGRFGRKAQTVSIEGFIRGPLFNHLGITSDPLSAELKALLPVPSAPIDDTGMLSSMIDLLVKKAYAQVAAPEEPTVDEDGVADPELSAEDLFDLVSFAMLLAAPRPDPPTATTEAGARRFEDLGCADCHVPALEGPRGPVPLYSDLLLHDMGEELADGMTMGLASGSEFRTQPLWAVGASAPYLHDGRADTLDEAIRLHGGESEAARDAYAVLEAGQQEEVLAFLESLGGATQKSDGLLPPNSPIPPTGVLGGPDAALTLQEAELFERGRAIFDRDMHLSEGTGPLFNGDSCRACHFLPAIGGSGPADVDVTRHGTLLDGVFTDPVQGTMAHRHSTQDVRPPIDETANVFGTRQTPPIFGLGFLENISEAQILANEDCDNPDPTAVSGCIHVLSTGEIGRLGWKANVPNLSEFARDAMFNELGITLPIVPGLTFGATEDSDAVPDPEISAGDLEALTFFMQRLAPPPRRSTNGHAENAGEMLFDSVGCIDCHVADFVTSAGVVAYTDLLLHQVAPDGTEGIAGGDAGPVEFRTPPLWGISLTPPYMHDGRSFSIEDAIARHDAEAASSRMEYESLSAEERERLLAFLNSL